MKRTSIIVLLALLLGILPADAVQKKKKAVVGKKQTPAKREAPKVAANYGKYDFTLTTLDGKKVQLADFAGKLVLVNIWAPWCGPCRIETPGFVKIYDEYKNRGLEIIGVAVQTNESDVRSFIAKENIRWPVGIRDEVAIDYGTYGLPDNYLFGPDGSLVKHFIGFTREESLRPTIDEALKKYKVTSSTSNPK